VAVFAHIDTTGWTLGYNGVLLPIGGPEGQLGDPLRCTAPAADGTVLRGRLEVTGEEDTATLHLGRDEAVGPQETPVAADAPPGTRWVYDREPVLRENRLTAAYLDNRAGVWCALRALARSPHIAVAFTTGEEQHGHGARVCARWLYDSFRLTQALIADTTWATEHVRCGEGPVVSLRDVHCPASPTFTASYLWPKRAASRTSARSSLRLVRRRPFATLLGPDRLGVRGGGGGRGAHVGGAG
jgi:putative aminopeptidase FrvX